MRTTKKKILPNLEFIWKRCPTSQFIPQHSWTYLYIFCRQNLFRPETSAHHNLGWISLLDGQVGITAEDCYIITKSSARRPLQGKHFENSSPSVKWPWLCTYQPSFIWWNFSQSIWKFPTQQNLLLMRFKAFFIWRTYCSCLLQVISLWTSWSTDFMKF